MHFLITLETQQVCVCIVYVCVYNLKSYASWEQHRNHIFILKEYALVMNSLAIIWVLTLAVN